MLVTKSNLEGTCGSVSEYSSGELEALLSTKLILTLMDGIVIRGEWKNDCFGVIIVMEGLSRSADGFFECCQKEISSEQQPSICSFI